MKHGHGGGGMHCQEGWGECRGGGGGLLTKFMLLSFHHMTIIKITFTCLLEEGYLISYSARREGLLINCLHFYSA